MNLFIAAWVNEMTDKTNMRQQETLDERVAAILEASPYIENGELGMAINDRLVIAQKLIKDLDAERLKAIALAICYKSWHYENNAECSASLAIKRATEDVGIALQIIKLTKTNSNNQTGE